MTMEDINTEGLYITDDFHTTIILAEIGVGLNIKDNGK